MPQQSIWTTTPHPSASVAVWNPNPTGRPQLPVDGRHPNTPFVGEERQVAEVHFWDAWKQAFHPGKALHLAPFYNDASDELDEVKRYIRNHDYYPTHCRW